MKTFETLAVSLVAIAVGGAIVYFLYTWSESNKAATNSANANANYFDQLNEQSALEQFASSAAGNSSGPDVIATVSGSSSSNTVASGSMTTGAAGT